SHHLELGAKQFIEGFEENVVGMKVGDKKVIHLKFPDPYHSAELAGKPVDFNVTLTGLKNKKLPDLSDEFVAQMMGASIPNQGEAAHTLESLKKTIQEDLEQSEVKRIETDLKNRLLKKLVSLNPVEVPLSLLKEQKQNLVEDTKKRMSEQGMSPEEFETYTQKWDKDFESSAREMIQSGFLIDTIAKEKDLNWREEDLEAKFEEYAKQTGIEIARIKEFYSRPEQMNRLTYTITEDKVVKFLLSSAKVTEVAKDKIKEALS
ncbi:MAG: trigger factor, partial [Bdellovibrio sp. CG10_big_fil_rev_8_21_14_0_10_47_8]